MKKLMIISTTVAFCGGLATMLAATSCDPECIRDHRTAVYLNLTSGRDHAWNPAHHPTTVSYAVFPGEDPTAATDFEGSFGMVPRMRPARCLDDDADCREYALGFDEPGTYEIDVEVCGKKFETTVEVPVSDDMCHVEPQEVELALDSSGCIKSAVPQDMAPSRTPGDDPGQPPECDRMARPSVYVVVGRTVGDVFTRVDVEQVWYTVTQRGDDEHDDDDDDDLEDKTRGEPKPAMCVQDPNGGPCIAWLAGFEEGGSFTITTQYCEVEVQETVWVEDPVDACHVDTQFVLLEVETRGCLATPDDSTPPDPEPPVPQPRMGYG